MRLGTLEYTNGSSDSGDDNFVRFAFGEVVGRGYVGDAFDTFDCFVKCTILYVLSVTDQVLLGLEWIRVRYRCDIFDDDVLEVGMIQDCLDLFAFAGRPDCTADRETSIE